MSTMFFENGATIGGAIYGANSNITFNGNNSSMLIIMEELYNGGAIFGGGSNITFSGEMSVMFDDNAVRYGGAIYLGGSNLLLDGNMLVSFVNNDMQVKLEELYLRVVPTLYLMETCQ